jgi:transcriptional regulator with XRE-family HTH domain
MGRRAKREDGRVRLKELLHKKGITQLQLSQMINVNVNVISKFITGDYRVVNTDFLAKMANVLNVSINDIYDTQCDHDELNRIKLMILDEILISEKISNKLNKSFTPNEKNYLVEMLKAKVYNIPKLPVYFLVNTILEADYYTDLPLRFKVKSTALADKVDSLNELEGMALINFVMKYNQNNKVNILDLFKIPDIKARK